MKYGLECEFFVGKRQNPIALLANGGPSYDLVGGLDASLTPDECGFLAEARGQPHGSIREAVFSLMADIHRLERAASKLDLQLVKLPNADVPYAEVLKARRQYSKGTIKFQNLYGHESHRQKRKKTAGLHISFTQPVDYTRLANGREIWLSYNSMWDFVQVFRYLDKAFATEIKEAQRNPGFYEIKDDGRVEYRSLPNTVDLMKVIEVVETVCHNNL